MELPLAVNAELKHFKSHSDIKTAYYVDTSGEGPPLVLIHSVNAAASTYEVKPLFEHYAGKRPVYALELPGFGHSDRSKRAYLPQLYANVITDLLQNIVQQPADVLALSLASEFAAMVATGQPELFKSLTVISPTGLSQVDVAAVIPGQSIHRVLTLPLLEQNLFSLLTRRGVIRYYLNQSFVGEVPDDFIDYAYNAAHQPGGSNAPLYFLSGQLFSGGICDEVYKKLQVPVLMIYDQDPNVNFERLPDLEAANPHWTSQKITPTMGLPHWEELNATVDALEGFWQI